ncbi:MAG: hypothetical protein ACRDY1_14525, partial [Acidimicrobiales bacterium]
YRAKDGGSTAQNADSFRRCRALLADDALVALFPEGISHDESMLQPLRTGAARIALGAAVDDVVPGVVVVPVGLTYDAKARFRSRALVQVGPARPAQRWATAYREDPPAAVREMTQELFVALRAVSPTYRSWMQATELRWIAELVHRPVADAGPVDIDLAQVEQTARDLADADGAGTRQGAMDELHRAATAYQRHLALIGLSDAQVADARHAGRRRRALAWQALRVAAALPAALVGVVVHVLPYRIMKRVGAIPDNESIQATVKLLGCFVLFTVVYVLLGVAAGVTWGPVAGAAAAAGAPACGYAAVRLGERLTRMGGVVAGARILRRRRAVLSAVLVHRADVVATATAVVEPVDR